jgi:pimeloyl-ACP methyl ester carboxylesterase
MDKNSEIRPFRIEIPQRDHNVVHWSEFDRGGHFLAIEQPELLTCDAREFFRPSRAVAEEVAA